MGEPRGSTVMLTHRGRKSGKPYRVKIWFVVIDGEAWIGSLDTERSWVKNLRASATAELDFGSGPERVRCEWVASADDIARFREAIKTKYPVLGRILSSLVRGTRCAFRTSSIGD